MRGIGPTNKRKAVKNERGKTAGQVVLDHLGGEVLSEKERQRITASLVGDTQKKEGKNGKG